MLIVYNNLLHLTLVMNRKTIEQKQALDWCAQKSIPAHQAFFPRIIREFDDGADEKPMMYGGD